MKIRHLLLLLPITTITALVIVSCGGDDAPCDAPLSITPGTWCITIQTTQNTCNVPLDSTPYTAVFTQDGSNLSALSEFNHTYTGTVCGNTARLRGNNEGIITDMNIDFSDASNATGSVVWDIDSGSCSGTDTFISAAGGCPR